MNDCKQARAFGHSRLDDLRPSTVLGADGVLVTAGRGFEAEGPGYVKKNASKRLAAITKLAFDVIPQDPA